MQGKRNTNLNLRSAPSTAGTSQQASSDHISSPPESCLISPAEPMCVNATGSDLQTLSGCQYGESGSGLNLQAPVNENGVKTEHDQSSFSNVFSEEGPISEQRQIEPSFRCVGSVHIGSCSNQSTEPSQSQNFCTSYASQNMSLNSRSFACTTNDGNSMESSVFPNLHKSNGLHFNQTSSAASSYENVGTSASSGSMVENDGSPGISLGNLSSSCKRKAFESTSGQSNTGGSSSSIKSENSLMHTFCQYHASSSSTLCTPPLNPPTAGNQEQLISRSESDNRGVPSDAFPTWSSARNADCSQRNFGRRLNSGSQQESLPFNNSSTGNSRLSTYFQHQPPRSVPRSDSLDLRLSAVPAVNSISPQNQPDSVHTASESRTVRPFFWNRNCVSRVGSSSGEGRAALPELANFRAPPENSMCGPEADLSLTQEGTNRALPGTPVDSCSDGLLASLGSSQNSIRQNQQRASDIDPWSLFPPLGSQARGQGGVISPSLSAPAAASSSETMVSSRVDSSQRPRQSHRRSAFLLEGQGDDIFGPPRSLHSLVADVEGRQRLFSEIHQILDAMRRGENMQAEDYSIFDTLILHGMAEPPDRHRDMRLDVDNMSYEELLELGERIGDVSTGLSEETILKCMKEKKYMSVTHTETSEHMEPCSVCQEDYGPGDNIGTLDCGHNFHTNCIKQWLMQKNLCPICKTTALAS